mmetsp:Transcript_27645/g.60061  ORF Transcript_27645/g.60061 Transcript_27645/m.60061 type:complete len:228 (+) Transcript_27645:1136-1819(+)
MVGPDSPLLWSFGSTFTMPSFIWNFGAVGEELAGLAPAAPEEEEVEDDACKPQVVARACKAPRDLRASKSPPAFGKVVKSCCKALKSLPEGLQIFCGPMARADGVGMDGVSLAVGVGDKKAELTIVAATPCGTAPVEAECDSDAAAFHACSPRLVAGSCVVVAVAGAVAVAVAVAVISVDVNDLVAALLPRSDWDGEGGFDDLPDGDDKVTTDHAGIKFADWYWYGW